ncbi:YpjP family protein [Ornithinibacillus salinisoli]|uniref:YpjP family protein n=1 Tax=Ornithinibacillus salinisoli TaxID=1848459 RepID=A0ABW4VVC3_9BACI
MKLWMRKIAVVLIAILTLGIYTPTYLITDEENEVVSPKVNEDGGITDSKGSVENAGDLDIHLTTDTEYDSLRNMTEQAKDQTIAKMGPRIIEKVEDEFMATILPNIEEALQTILTNVGDENLSYVSITEQPTEGYGEKIFNVYDNQLKKDIARFHVRRDVRPQEGYWFNFHYHVSEDGYEKHHTIGEIYWDKNTPPKWMA